MRLCEVRAGLSGITRSLDPRLLTVDQAKVALADATAIKNTAALLEARLGRRVTEAAEWERAGFPSAEAWLAHRTGTSPSKAKEALDTAKRLEELPAVSEAAEQGELSVEQTAMIADAATVDPDAEQRLLDAAKVRPLGQLRDECAKTKRAADQNAEETARRIRAARSLRFSRALDGAARMFGITTPDQLAVVKTAVEHVADELFHQARRAGRYEPREAYMMDALEQICRDWMHGRSALTTDTDDDSATDAADADGDDGRVADGLSDDEPGTAPPGQRQRRPKPPAWLGLLRIDIEAFRRGSVDGDELCEIAGVGPISIDTARRLLGDAVLKLVITRGVDVLNVTHLGRSATVAQHVALLWQSPGCVITSCSRMAGIETDHSDDWADTHRTELKKLRRYCDHHHDLKTYKGWGEVRSPDGTVEMVPPDDPRHPRRAGPEPPGEAAPEPESRSLFDEDAA